MIVLDNRLAFPPAESAGPDGLLAVGGDLSVERLLLAYRSGAFPWTTRPVTWWSPDPRAIFELERFHVPRSLAKVLRQNIFNVTVNRAFGAVMEGCAASAPGRRSTWINRDFVQAYTKLHQERHAHSIECWQNGELVGGIYGVAIGGFFAGESMFHRAKNASKVALFHLVHLLKQQQFELFDIQMKTSVTEQLGAVNVSRVEYLKRLEVALNLQRKLAVF